MAWLDALAAVMKARSPHNEAGIEHDQAPAREMLQDIEAGINSIWHRGDDERRQRSRPAEPVPQGTRAALDALVLRLTQGARAIDRWVDRSHLSRPRSGVRQGSLDADANGTPVFIHPGDSGAAVDARLLRVKEDFTEQERHCRAAAFAMWNLRHRVEALVSRAVRLPLFGKQPMGAGVYTTIKRRADYRRFFILNVAVTDLYDLDDMRAFLRDALADEDLRESAAPWSRRPYANVDEKAKDILHCMGYWLDNMGHGQPGGTVAAGARRGEGRPRQRPVLTPTARRAPGHSPASRGALGLSRTPCAPTLVTSKEMPAWV